MQNKLFSNYFNIIAYLTETQRNKIVSIAINQRY